jgi:hypothetical protein
VLSADTTTREKMTISPVATLRAPMGGHLVSRKKMKSPKTLTKKKPMMTAEKQSFFIYKLFFKKVLTNAAGCGIIVSELREII